MNRRPGINPLPKGRGTDARSASGGGGCLIPRGLAAAIVLLAAPFPALGQPPYRPVGDRFELTRPIRFETDLFGPVVLTRGYRSNGSSSPVADSEATRLAGFLHDALYAASGHLRFPTGRPRRWTRAEADRIYCNQMRRLGAARWHARLNCTGVMAGVTAKTWRQLAWKRERRWRGWARGSK